jgi:phosphoribosylaminoimidazole-succinocarboxamide synthase
MHSFSTPQLRLLHRGKVRDSFRVDDRRRLIVVTDRISAFDLKMHTDIPRKGEVLNRLAAWWFDRTKDLVNNHIVEIVDAQAMLVVEAVPVRVEMIVRGYISGSMWRGYQEGQRTFSGVTVPEGLKENDRLPTPVVTPTTKEESDREITPAEIVASGLCSQALYDQMADTAMKLFVRGTETLAEKGILLADTKYEFGTVNGSLTLIDEIHTPDSSRFWEAGAWAQDHAGVPSMDKEFVRKWLRRNRDAQGNYQRVLPPDVVKETRARYEEILHRITGVKLDPDVDVEERLYRSLVRAKLLRDGYVAIVMGSRADLSFAHKIRDALRPYDVHVDMRVVSAHKNGERIGEVVAEYNASVEPGVVIAVAGESNGLGGALSANLNVPVINCPPLSDGADYEINIHSSLRMPSKAPAMTVVKPGLAAEAAVRALNLRRLRAKVDADIAAMKEGLLADDAAVREGRDE